MLGKLDTAPEFGPVVVLVLDRDRIADYQKMVASCATPASAPRCISAIPRTWASS